MGHLCVSPIATPIPSHPVPFLLSTFSGGHFTHRSVSSVYLPVGEALRSFFSLPYRGRNGGSQRKGGLLEGLPLVRGSGTSAPDAAGRVERTGTSQLESLWDSGRTEQEIFLLCQLSDALSALRRGQGRDTADWQVRGVSLGRVPGNRAGVAPCLVLCAAGLSNPCYDCSAQQKCVLQKGTITVSAQGLGGGNAPGTSDHFCQLGKADFCLAPGLPASFRDEFSSSDG